MKQSGININKLLLLCLLYINCQYHAPSEPTEENKNPTLTLYMDTEIRDGYYRVKYPSGSQSYYTAIHYHTEPITRVFWTALDSFTFVYWGQEITEPIANYSTYSDADGNGRQLVYLYPNHIGDTLDIVAWIDTAKYISFILEEE